MVDSLLPFWSRVRQLSQCGYRSRPCGIIAHLTSISLQRLQEETVKRRPRAHHQLSRAARPLPLLRSKTQLAIILGRSEHSTYIHTVTLELRTKLECRYRYSVRLHLRCIDRYRSGTGNTT